MRLSWKGLKNYRGSTALNAHTRAVVIGFGRSPTIVKVQRDGMQTITAYHVDLWEIDPQLPLPGVPE